jgi:SAM-dependent methyltransferase
MNSNPSGPVTPQKIIIRAEREVAYDSPDHIRPWGTKRDNSVNRRFNDKLYRLFPQSKQLSILDMGCSGGGFVKSCLDDGCLAVGVEGSDFSKKLRRAEWRTIPEFLFTCDITKKFDCFIEEGGESRRLMFDVVTSWEVMEHIAENDIVHVAQNVARHLVPGGLWITSITPVQDEIDGVKLHQTIQQKPWWLNKLSQLGYEHLEEYVRYFNTQFVRGPKYGAPDSFHLVLTNDRARVPLIPQESLLRRLNDLWVGSKIQRIITGTY